MPLPVAPKSNLMQRAIDTHGEPTDDRSLGNTSDDDTDSVITPRMPDLDDLAHRVYPLLKRLIAMERERVRSF